MTSLLPSLVILFVLGTDAWGYMDAKANADRGTPVVFSLPPLQLDTPVAWTVACLFLWIIFFPAYVGRRNSPG
ncbi:MAG: hypothetical protein ACXVES_05900 [Actinomycetota bacterium]